MTRDLHIGVPAASSSINIVWRRSFAQLIGEKQEETMLGAWSSNLSWLSTTSRWQMRHSVSHVRLNKEFLSPGEKVDPLVLSTRRPLRTIDGTPLLGD